MYLASCDYQMNRHTNCILNLVCYMLCGVSPNRNRADYAKRHWCMHGVDAKGNDYLLKGEVQWVKRESNLQFSLVRS